MNERPDPRQRATAARRARAQRIHELRMRVVAGAVAIFVAAWTGIFVQLASGHDPALSRSAAAVATHTSDPDATTGDTSGATGDSTATVTSSGSTSGEASSGDDGSGSAQTSSAPAAVTTRQS